MPDGNADYLQTKNCFMKMSEIFGHLPAAHATPGKNSQSPGPASEYLLPGNFFQNLQQGRVLMMMFLRVSI
jgi:hypothetical protein